MVVGRGGGGCGIQDWGEAGERERAEGNWFTRCTQSAKDLFLSGRSPVDKRQEV